MVEDPLYGPLFNRSITQEVGLGKEKEMKVRAIPFGFDKPQGSIGNLIFSWTVNGIEKTELGTNDSIILRAPEGASGFSKIGLTIRNSKNILQDASDLFDAIYGSEKSIINNKDTTGGPAF
jgi:hypothetical protein